jgi:hypothetical protein
MIRVYSWTLFSWRPLQLGGKIHFVFWAKHANGCELMNKLNWGLGNSGRLGEKRAENFLATVWGYL